MEDNRIYKTVEEILEGRIRPELGRHGGSIVLVKIEDTVAYIRLTGHCSGCPSAKYTLENLVKEEIMRHTNLISDVRLHEEVSQELYDFARDILAAKQRRIS